MKIFILFFVLLRGLAPQQAKATSLINEPDFPAKGIVSKDVDNFNDINIDYSRFLGRATDKDPAEKILKIKVENNNTKFLRAGDEVQFTVGERETEPCIGNVRDVEEFYFVIYVRNLSVCYAKGEYFRRGTLLSFWSPILAKRVEQAARHRKTLLVQKDDFLRQLNKVNHFLWSYDPERAKVAAEYDRRILEVQKEKEKALDRLGGLRKDSIVLQKELIKKLDGIDKELKFYFIERQELFVDRWNLDHDLGLPVGERPQDIKSEDDAPIVKENRWHKTNFQ